MRIGLLLWSNCYLNLAVSVINLLRMHMLLYMATVTLLPGRVRKLLEVPTQRLVIALFPLRISQVLSAEVEDCIARLSTHLVEFSLDELLVNVDFFVFSGANLRNCVSSICVLANEFSECVV